MFGYITNSKLRIASLSGVLAAILVACLLSNSCAQGTQAVSDSGCTTQITGRPGSGMRVIAIREREFEFCFQECEEDPLCQVYSSPIADLGVCPSFPQL